MISPESLAGHYHQMLQEKRRERYQVVSTIHDEITVKVDMTTQEGHYYLHVGRGHPVKVISGRNQVWTGDGYRFMYKVEDVVTGQMFNVQRKELGEELNEMEVIAWAAR